MAQPKAGARSRGGERALLPAKSIPIVINGNNKPGLSMSDAQYALGVRAKDLVSQGGAEGE
jgi:hypothetical protein